MTPERDKLLIRLIGGLCIGFGLVLMLSTILITLVALFNVPTGNVLGGTIAVALALVMASTLMGCGAQFQRLGAFVSIDVLSVRMSWAALLIVMVLGGAVAYWVVPPLCALSVLITLLLLAIRPAVIRLSG